MWEEYPMSDQVRWPLDERVIGVVGVAPMATADFFTKLSARSVAKDWNHPRVIIDSNPKIPSRGRCLDLGEADPVPFIRRSMQFLVQEGATVLALPCNTAHIFYGRYAQGMSGVIIPNMIDVTATTAAERLPVGHKKVLVLASRQVMLHELYREPLARRGVEYLPAPNQALVSEAIEAVKQGSSAVALCRELLHAMADAQRAHGVGGILLGCTELSMLFGPGDFQADFCVIDSNQALADHCHALAQGEAPPRS